MKHLFLALVLITSLLLSACKSPSPTPAAAAPTQQEARLIAVLKSDASHKERADACRELAHVGTKASVPVLVGLLDDEKMSHMARYGLETNPDPAVNTALRDALPRLKSRQLAGVITSLGVRKDAEAAKPLGKLLQNADPDVASAAARALGDIATKPAVQALEAALPTATGAQQLAVCEGMFRCAEACVTKGQQKDAIRIYDQLRNLANAPQQVRAGALRGAILARGSEGVGLLTAALRGADWVLADAAARTAMEMPGSTVASALVAELPGLAGDRRILVLQAVGKRADTVAVPAVVAVAQSGDKPVRLAAIQTLAEIGHASAAQPLADLIRDADRGIAEAARNAFASLPGREADKLVLAMVGSGDSATKLAGLELVALRRMTHAVPTLQKATSDADPKVRAAALKQLSEFGGEAELSGLLSQLESANDPQTLSAVADALGTLCARISKPAVCAGAIIPRMQHAPPAQKAAMVKVLASVGGAQALGAVSGAVGSSEAVVHAAALDTLAEWPSVDAAPELLKLARSLSAEEQKRQCLRSYLRWAGDADVPAKDRLAMCKESAGLVQRVEEKKLLLAALGSVNSLEAVAEIQPFTDDAAVREEACVAIVTIGERMAKSQTGTKLAPKVVASLEKVGQTTGNAELAKRAKALVDANK